MMINDEHTYDMRMHMCMIGMQSHFRESQTWNLINMLKVLIVLRYSRSTHAMSIHTLHTINIIIALPSHKWLQLVSCKLIATCRLQFDCNLFFNNEVIPN